MVSKDMHHMHVLSGMSTNNSNWTIMHSLLGFHTTVVLQGIDSLAELVKYLTHTQTYEVQGMLVE